MISPQSVLITRKLLEASDLDSDAAFITFNITRPPVAGEVQKKRDWETVGWRIDQFPQSDLFQVRLSDLNKFRSGAFRLK